MDSRKVRRTFIVASTLLILIVLSFTGGLNITSFKDNYTESLVSSYAVSGSKAVRNIEYAVKYGKPLDNFLGIEHTLSEVLEETPAIEEAQVVLPNGEVIYNQFGKVSDVMLSERMMSQFAFSQDKAENEPYHFLLHEGDYYIFLPIYDRAEKWIGSLALLFAQEVVATHTNPYMWKLIGYLGGLAVFSLVCLIFFSMKVSILNDDRTMSKKRVLSSLIIILGIVQIVFGMMNYQMFHRAYIDIAHHNTTHIATIMKKDIESVIEKGVAYRQLYQLEDYLQNIIQSVPVIEHIQLSSGDGQLEFKTDEKRIDANIEESRYVYSTLLEEDATGISLDLQVLASEQYISSKMKNIILDMGTILLTSFLFLVELTLFLLIYLGRQFRDTKRDVSDEATNEIAIIRPITFLLFFGIFMSVSFIPIVMNELYEPMFGLSKSVILGLPLTVEMFFGGVATVIAGYLIDKQDWKRTFFLGVTIVALGSLLSSLATTALYFIFARGVVGAGYGFSLIALRSFVNTARSENVRTSGLSSLFAGIYAGLNCGVIVGAMLAERIGYANVFFVAFCMLVLTFIFALLFLRNSKREAAVQSDVPKSRPVHIFRFLTHKQVLGLFVLVVIPTAVSGMFLDYYFPLFAEETGLSSSNVGRAFLLNGLCIVYLGPFLSKFFTKHLGDFQTVLLGGLIITIGLIYFSWQGTVVAAIVAIILLGLSDSFALVAQNNYFVKIDASQKLGVAKALSYFDNIRKTGQMVGPMVFGSVVTMGFVGIGMLGILFLCFLALFLIFCRERIGKEVSN